MKSFLGRSGAALVLCLAIGVAFGMSGCQGAKSRTNTLAHPEPTTSAERRGDAYLKSGSLKGALQEYDRALEEGAPEHVINWRKGNAYFSARKWEEAYVHFRQAINGRPDWVLAQEGAGFAAFEMGEFSKSREYFQRSSELNPDNWVPYAFLAVINNVLGNNAAAQEANQKAIELAGEDKILADATIKRAYAKAVVVFEEQGDPRKSAVADTGGEDDPLGRLESLAAAPVRTPEAVPDADEEPESDGGWEVVEEKRVPGRILGLDGSVSGNATRSANATVSEIAASDSPELPEANATQVPASGSSESGGHSAGDSVVANATREIVDANATEESGLLMSASDSVTVIESPGYDEINGIPAVAANGTGAGNATPDAAGSEPASAIAAEVDARQADGRQDAVEEPEPTRDEDRAPQAPAHSAETEPDTATATADVAAAESEAAKGVSDTAPVQPAPSASGGAEEPKSPAPSEPRDTRVAEAGMVYAVLESSWRDEPDAAKRIADLEKQGIRAHLVPSEIEGKGFWYRVMIGPRKKLQSCKDIKVELQNRFGLTGLVILKVPESKF
ncbi:hypothetical protein DPQ33_08990 [Oceanidesulfovibrio indonesiensis]|uniref:SPOR domain-containing protein n=1 Tax=Oceanidesulfovibrio indonesiensis TaxID=54767 RepID=A0A7M3MER9_9BACT|nr:SPOR domain-containing protein [Oceanidesulfovibrio indonesiensis]TVM17311.1 hypothetical protein DPQ33_08990 [Oceanidesulfovibrio indonesiensis]